MSSLGVDIFPESRYPHIPSISTLTLGGRLDEKLQAISAAGFKGIEIFEGDVRRFTHSRQEVRNLCTWLKISIMAYPLEGSSISTTRISRQCEKMKELGCGVMVVPGDAVTDIDELVAALQVASKFEIKIALDAVPWATWISTWQLALETIERINHPRLGLCLDSFNILTSKSGLTDITGIPAHRVFHVRIADAPILMLDPKVYSRHHRNFPAQGSLDVISFLKSVRNIGYTGALFLAVYNDDIRAAPLNRTASEGIQSLQLLMDQVYGNVLPPPPEVICIEAIEFAVAEGLSPRLERFFRDLGLRKVARHVYGNISVFSAGNVHMLLNSEPDSTASALMAIHDLSVLALAVRVASLPAATARAEAIGCVIVPAAPDAPGMVKIHSPDGKSYVYLVDQQQTWKSVFRYEPDEEPGNAHPFLGIDHVAHAVDRISMDRMVLFCKALFDMEVQGIFELQDPFGVTKSRKLVTSNGNLRFPMNMSDDRATSVGKLIRDSGGSVVHHVAFQTSDIFSTVLEIQKTASRNRFLRVPRHYYEEISLRYRLPPDFVARMREFDIMYDRDEVGEFLHLSTEQFGGDMFFVEIVERRGRYSGFGTVNAPIRMGLHHERRNVSLRALPDAQGSPTRASVVDDKGKRMLVVFPDGSTDILRLVGTILGRPYVVHEFGEFPTDEVIGVSASLAERVLSTVELGTFTTLHLHPLSDALDLHAYASVSSRCTYEYLFPPAPHPFPIRDFTRFLSFITHQSSSTDRILKKSRSTFIPLTFPDLRTALPNLDIITIGADAIELRVDYLNPFPSTSADNPPPPLSYIASQLFLLRSQSDLPIIFTLRSPPEGGRCPAFADPSITHSLLLKGLQWGCEFIDVELRLPSTIQASLCTLAPPTKIIASYHDLVGTLSWSHLDEPSRLFHTGRSYSSVTKIVGFATSIQDNFALEQFRSKITATYPDHPLLAFNANAPGQMSRILNTFFTPITHPLLPNPAAPGQLSVAEINKARTIMGLEQPRTIYTIGLPELGFWRKCINELGLPHRYQSLPSTLPVPQLAALARQLDFGGAFLNSPIPATTGFLSTITGTAREVEWVDTITITRGDNVSATTLLSSLLVLRTPGGWRQSQGLVLASSPGEGAAGVWALRQVGVEAVWTVGFTSKDCLKWKKETKGAEGVGVVVSCLPREERQLIGPLVGMVEEARREQGMDGKVVIVEARGEEGWKDFVERGLEALVGMRVGGEAVWVG